MKVFDPTSPLLRSVSSAIVSSGGPPEVVMRSGGVETLTAFIFPCLPYGYLSYSSAESIWEQEEEALEDVNIRVCISSDGGLEISEGDDDGIWLESSLKAGDELDEVLEFFFTARAKQINTTELVPKELSALIDDVFLLLPPSLARTTEMEPALIPLKGSQLFRSYPEIAETVDAWLTDDWSDVSRLNFPETACADGLFNSAQSLRPGDIVLSGQGGVYFGGMVKVDAESHIGLDPALVLRPKPGVSRMWLVDYFEHATEAEGLIERICSGWQHLPKGLARISIQIPSSKRDQIASTIERRSARLDYIGYLKQAMRMREPFNQIGATYRKRARTVRGLHTELLDELDAILHPLPFFLEYPYRQFRREDDHLRKVRAGQRLLGILAKVPIYLVIEELLSEGHPQGKMLLEQLTKNPASDGTLVELHETTAKALSGEETSPLPMFSELLSTIANKTQLMKIVTARNRMHHEPYDDTSFLKSVDENAPAILDSLREALTDCHFLVPRHAKMVSGEKILTAEDIRSSEAHFRIVDLKVSLPLEEFPSNKLLAWRKTPERSLVFGNLLTAEMVTKESRDFGVFDRMENNKPHFTFLRSD